MKRYVRLIIFTLFALGSAFFIGGLYIQTTFESQLNWDGIPRYLAAMGRLGELENAYPNLMLWTVLPTAIFWGIAITMWRHNEEVYNRKEEGK